MPTFTSLPLDTERLILRPYRPEDTNAVFEMFSDPRVMRYWSWLPWTELDQAKDAVTRDIEAYEGGRYLRLGIERREDHAFLGQCILLNFVAHSRRAEIGYSLASWAWGRGYMHEALEKLVCYGFESLNLNRLEADIDPRNEASARSLERLGFLREGLMRDRWIVGDEVSDTAFYGLLRKDWKSPAHGHGATSPFH